MHARSLLTLCAISASCLLVTHLSQAGQAATPPYPDWPWPTGVQEPPKPDDGQLFHIPGSTKSYTTRKSTGARAPSTGFPTCTLRLLLR